jgi:C-terminal processing protease CtpA/Prc
MVRAIHNLTLKRQSGQKWGFGVTGGIDVKLTFRVEKVNLHGPAGEAGLKNLDYLIKINSQEVFNFKHNELVNMVRNAGGETLELEVERYDFVAKYIEYKYHSTCQPYMGAGNFNF